MGYNDKNLNWVESNGTAINPHNKIYSISNNRRTIHYSLTLTTFHSITEMEIEAYRKQGWEYEGCYSLTSNPPQNQYTFKRSETD